MKKIYVYIMLIGVIASSCSKSYESLEVNPNSPESVPASLVLNGIEVSLAPGAWGIQQRWNQFSNCNYNYYGNQEYNWSGASLSYGTLKNVVKMEEEAAKSGAAAVNPYAAIGKFVRAYLFYQMTMSVGDLPMAEALKGAENLKPKYNTQKEIFIQVNKWLEEANADFAGLISKGDNSLLGDFYYNNDLRKWQKLVNTFRLRVLITLSKKESDTDLNVKGTFAKIINGAATYPVFTSMADNFQFVYVNPFNKYPSNPDNYGFDATRYNTSSTYLDILKLNKDPRTFVVAEPAGSKLKSGLLPSDHNAFVGASPAADLADMSSKAGVDNGASFVPGEYSFNGRKRYYSTYTAENTFIVGYPEMCFNIAEAINRGWLTGDAEQWYKNGMNASIAFYGLKDGVNTCYYLKAGGKVTESGDYVAYNVSFNFNDFYAQPSVRYAGNNAAGLEQIIKQKYVAFFQNSGAEAYFNYRRTGLPVFAQGGPGTGNSGKIPLRFQYPGTERTTNGENLASALSAQFGGNDDINAAMWVIK
jgi:hypothetical protein